DGEGDVDRHVGAVDVDAADHVEVDDAPVQLGVLHGAKSVDDLGFGDGHGKWPPGISPIRIGRIVAWLKKASRRPNSPPLSWPSPALLATPPAARSTCS